MSVVTDDRVPFGYIAWISPSRLFPSMAMSRQSASDRITVTLSPRVFMALRDRADLEGRSTSNLAAFLLESALAIPKTPPADRRLGVDSALCG